MQKIRSAVGPHVAAMAKQHGVTQRAISRHLGVPQTQVSQRMTGQAHVTASELHGIASLLGTSVADLIPDSEPPVMPRLTVGHVLALAVVLRVDPLILMDRLTDPVRLAHLQAS